MLQETILYRIHHYHHLFVAVQCVGPVTDQRPVLVLPPSFSTLSQCNSSSTCDPKKNFTFLLITAAAFVVSKYKRIINN